MSSRRVNSRIQFRMFVSKTEAINTRSLSYSKMLT